MRKSDPIRVMQCLCQLVILGAFALLVFGALARWSVRAVDVGVLADRELLDRVRTVPITCTGLNINTYTENSLSYHESLRALSVSISHALLGIGAPGLVVGVMQLVFMRRLKRLIDAAP
jgi:hypothetical protein